MYEFDDTPEKTPAISLDLQSWLELLVRLSGIILLLIGLWASIQVLMEAFQLYQQPVKIEMLTEAIERGSNLDTSIAKSESPRDTMTSEQVYQGIGKPTNRGQDIRLSYFIAWIVALLILLLVSMIAFSFLRIGAELILQDKELKRTLKLLIKEIGTNKQ